MHRARARQRVQGELSLRLAAADSARVGEAGLVRRELAVDGFRVRLVTIASGDLRRVAWCE